MTQSNYLKDYAESFAIFAKYEPDCDSPELDYGSIFVSLKEPVSPEDLERLVELGWELELTYGNRYIKVS
jgi:hypothetical protein